MTYKELLSTTDWAILRTRILVRDKFKCNNCSNKHLINREDISFHSLILFYEDWTSGNIPKFIENPTEFFSWSLDKIDEKFFYNRFTYLDLIKLEQENKSVFLTVLKDAAGTNIEYGIVSISHLSVKNLDNEEIKEMLNNQIGSTEWHFRYGLNVHHTYYMEGKYPWLYPKETLVTLCDYCHESLHKSEIIPHYDENGKLLGQINPIT